MKMHMRVNAKTYRLIQNDIRKDRKIAAIKTLRASVNCGLKEAKLAIERLMHESDPGTRYPHSVKEGARIVCGPLIKKLVLDFGDGDIEVDLEAMELNILMELPKIGLDACGEILDLVAALKAFANGHKIGILNGEDNENR